MDVLPGLAAFFVFLVEGVDDGNGGRPILQAELEGRGQHHTAISGGYLVAARQRDSRRPVLVLFVF